MSNAIKRLSLPDLQNNREEFLSELYLGLKEYGFVILGEHNISREKLDQAYELGKQFFELPVDVKLKYDSGSGGARGYTAFGRENAKGNPHSDLKEFWHVGPDLGCENNNSQFGTKEQHLQHKMRCQYVYHLVAIV